MAETSAEGDAGQIFRMLLVSSSICTLEPASLTPLLFFPFSSPHLLCCIVGSYLLLTMIIPRSPASNPMLHSLVSAAAKVRLSTTSVQRWLNEKNSENPSFGSWSSSRLSLMTSMVILQTFCSDWRSRSRPQAWLGIGSAQRPY